MPDLNTEDATEIVKLFMESDLEDLDVQVGDVRIAVSRNARAGTGAGWNPGSAPARQPAAQQPMSDTTTDGPAPIAGDAAGADTSAAGGPAPTPMSPADSSTADASDAGHGREGLFEVKAPILGVFYRRPSPDKPPFVEIGAEVSESDPVCIIDVMKLFNQVSAGCRGRIVEICVEDNATVEYGQTLMYIEPTS